jgi:hypothetical protein
LIKLVDTGILRDFNAIKISLTALARVRRRKRHAVYSLILCALELQSQHGLVANSGFTIHGIDGLRKEEHGMHGRERHFRGEFSEGARQADYAVDLIDQRIRVSFFYKFPR